MQHMRIFSWLHTLRPLAIRLLITTLALVLLAGLAIPATTAQQLSFSGCSSGEIVAVVNAEFEQEIVDLTNEYRAQNGLPPLTRVTQLDNAARYHAADMAQDDYTAHASHDNVNGTLEEVCGSFERISAYYNAQTTAENIAWGYSSAESVVEAWIGSAGHRENLLREGITEIGIGYYAGGSQRNYWVQVLGTPAGEHPNPAETPVTETPVAETPVTETPTTDTGQTTPPTENAVYLPLIGR